jgi:hypothetical protein
MDILTVVVVFLILEGAICGLCCYACRERQVSGDSEKASKKMSYHIGPHSPRMTFLEGLRLTLAAVRMPA